MTPAVAAVAATVPTLSERRDAAHRSGARIRLRLMPDQTWQAYVMHRDPHHICAAWTASYERSLHLALRAWENRR